MLSTRPQRWRVATAGWVALQAGQNGDAGDDARRPGRMAKFSGMGSVLEEVGMTSEFWLPEQQKKVLDRMRLIWFHYHIFKDYQGKIAMEAVLNTGIKSIIQQHPGVEKVLNDYGIGCGPCSVGTCLLKDIVSIHNLAPETEQELLTRIFRIIYPGQAIVVPLRQRSKSVTSKEAQLSPPMKMLVNEHALIKRLLALIPQLIAELDLNLPSVKTALRDTVDFIRSYADRYHHAKEEDILFKYFDTKADILQVMLADHDSARGHARAVLAALEHLSTAEVAEHLNAYCELLTQHIKKEDEILYPWMDRQLNDSQVGRLFNQFSKANQTLQGTAEKYQALIVRLEQALAQSGKHAAQQTLATATR